MQIASAKIRRCRITERRMIAAYLRNGRDEGESLAAELRNEWYDGDK